MGAHHENLRRGDQFDRPLSFQEDISTQPSIDISQEPFYLCEADWLRLKRFSASLSAWSKAIAVAAIGSWFPLVAKVIHRLVSKESPTIEAWEWWTLPAGLGLSCVLLLAGRCIPSERRQLVKEIDSHFSSAPRTRRLSEPRG